MPIDISMCPGGECPLKDNCLRFTGVIYGRQDFFGTPPYLNQIGDCSYFIDDRPAQEAIQHQSYAFWQEDGCPDGEDLTYWFRAEMYLIELKRNNG